MDLPPEVNDWVAKYCAIDPERLLAFGSVHPRYVSDAGAEVDRLKKIGIRGLKVHPSHQLFAPNQYRNGLGPLRTMYERAQAVRMPVMIHTGTSIFPGARNAYAQPILADDVGVDFPDLVVILAHGGRPLWMNEAFFLVRRHPNMYMDISGIPPQKLMEYFPRIEEIADKVLFGTDWPGPGVPGVRGNIEKFRALPISAGGPAENIVRECGPAFPAPAKTRGVDRIMEVKTIGVIGAGTMGRGIAYAAAYGGYRTILEDVSPEMLEQGIAYIRQSLEEGVARGKVTEEQRNIALANFNDFTLGGRPVQGSRPPDRSCSRRNGSQARDFHHLR